ncbi:MAG: Outer membrane protein assembly factor BamD [bacterium]|nr:Outer membrane protein assembly factor BamD [bacterium]
MLTPKKKLTRREMKEDKLVTTWFKATDWLTQHSREVLLAAGGVVVIIGLIILFNWMKSRDEQEAAEQFAQARAEYNKQNYTGTIPLLEKLVSEHGGSKSAGLAMIYLANAYMQTKDYVNAEKYYQKYLDDGDDDPILNASAAFGVAATQEERGEFAKAAKLYEEGANDYPDSYRAPQLLLNAARCYKQASQTEAARRVLQKIIDKYPKSSLLEDAKLLFAETGQASS